jgi:hypothetical protein
MSVAFLAVTPNIVFAKAGSFTGDDWFKYCLSDQPSGPPPADRYEQDMVVYCAGYIEASVTMITALDACIPDTATPADVILATVNWFRKHPDQKPFLLAGSIATAVREKWPCH